MDAERLKSNIVLIGMPGSGKSTVGKLLAERLSFGFIDFDSYIEKKENKSLQKIIDEKGDEGFCEIEEKRILELLPFKNYVMAPGGSVIYSSKVMDELSKSSFFVFLHLPFKAVRERLTNKSERGIVGFSKDSLKEIYKKRTLLYKQYSDIRVDCLDKIPEEVAAEIIQKIEKLKKN